MLAGADSAGNHNILGQSGEIGSFPRAPLTISHSAAVENLVYGRQSSWRGRPRCSTDVSVCACRVSEAVRIAGSLIFILLLFMFTAVLVKVRMEQDRFFSVTMATIWFINCEWAGPRTLLF